MTNTSEIEKTFEDYLLDAQLILTSKNCTSYEQYLVEAKDELNVYPELHQAADNYLLKQGSTKRYIDYLIEAKMISSEYKREGSELNQIMKEESFLYYIHIKTGISMGQLFALNVREDFQIRTSESILRFLTPK